MGNGVTYVVSKYEDEENVFKPLQLFDEEERKPNLIRRITAAITRKPPETVKIDESLTLPMAPETMANYGLNCYYKSGQVAAAYNIISETVVRGLTIKAKSGQEADQYKIDEYIQHVRFNDKIRMCILSALNCGRAVIEIDNDKFKVRDPRSFKIDWDFENDRIKSVAQVGNSNTLNKDKIELFIINRLFSDDVWGVSATLPAFDSIDLFLEAKKGFKAMIKRFRKPMVIAKYPKNASGQEKDDVESYLMDENYDSVLMSPIDWEFEILSLAQAAFNTKEFLTEISDQIFVDLRFPKSAILADSYKSDTKERIKLLLFDRCRPIQDVTTDFITHIFRKHLNVDVIVTYEEVRSEEGLALVETTIKIADSISKFTEIMKDSPVAQEKNQEIMDIMKNLIDSAKQIAGGGVF